MPDPQPGASGCVVRGAPRLDFGVGWALLVRRELVSRAARRESSQVGYTTNRRPGRCRRYPSRLTAPRPRMRASAEATEPQSRVVGPPPETMRALVDKERARSRSRAGGRAGLPGSTGDDDSRSPRRLSSRVPLLVKAAAGGGGRGNGAPSTTPCLPAAIAAAHLGGGRRVRRRSRSPQRRLGEARHVPRSRSSPMPTAA